MQKMPFFIAITMATAFFTQTQGAALGAPSPIIVTNSGTLLSSTYESNTIAASSGSWSAGSEPLGALTLLSPFEAVAAKASNEREGFPLSSASGWQSDEMFSSLEVTPVPEPAAWVAALFVFALLAWQQLRRFFSRSNSVRAAVTA